MKWFILLVLSGCITETTVEPTAVDAGECPPVLDEGPYCRNITRLRNQWHAATQGNFLACETDDDCTGICICGACGVP